MLLGLMLFAAIIGGWIAYMLHIPRVVGYLVAGAGLKAIWVFTMGASSATEPASALIPIKDLALGLILFSIGSVFEGRHFRAVGRNVMRITLCECGLTVLLVFAAIIVTLLASGVIPGAVACSLALLLGLAAQATAPAATLLVVREYESKGPVTDAVLSLVGMNNVMCIVSFYIAFTLLSASGILGDATVASSPAVWKALLTSIVGSVALGSVVGILLAAVHSHLRSHETFIVLLAVLLVLAQIEQYLLGRGFVSYNFMLVAICTGAVFTNVAFDPDRLEAAVSSLGQPLMVAFFVLAGFKLHIFSFADAPAQESSLLIVLPLGAAYLLARVAGKLAGVWLGLRWTGRMDELRPYLGMALLCQAAVVIGLADWVRRYWNDQDAVHLFETTVLGTVAVFEIAGAILTRWTVVRSGEVKTISMVHRQASDGRRESTISLLLTSLKRALGRTANVDLNDVGVRHIMRTNVKCLKAAADLDEVLRFIEHSRENVFTVVDERGDYIGLIRYSDLREVIYDPAIRELITAADLASANTPVALLDDPLELLLKRFQQTDHGLLPVLETDRSRRIVGVVEQRDLLRALRHVEQGAIKERGSSA